MRLLDAKTLDIRICSLTNIEEALGSEVTISSSIGCGSLGINDESGHYFVRVTASANSSMMIFEQLVLGEIGNGASGGAYSILSMSASSLSLSNAFVEQLIAPIRALARLSYE